MKKILLISSFVMLFMVTRAFSQDQLTYSYDYKTRGQHKLLRMRIQIADTVKWSKFYVMLGTTPEQSDILLERIRYEKLHNHKKYQVKNKLRFEKHGDVVYGQLRMPRTDRPFVTLVFQKENGEIITGVLK